MPLSTIEQFLHATVRLETFAADGSCSWGSGFFYHFIGPGYHVVGVVTNKHVVEGAVRAQVHLTERATDGGPLIGSHHLVRINGFDKCWVGHPDSGVDLCVIFFNSVLEQLDRTGRHYFIVGFDDQVLPSEEELGELTALEEILMIGYPNGLWDSTNNMPILRRGVTATHPAIDYQGRAEFVIDAACFPGSSGSPVLLYNSGSWNTKQGFNIGGERVKLLGLLYAGPQQTAEGEVRVINIPTSQRVISEAKVMINLGYIIKARRIREMHEPIVQALERAKRQDVNGGN